MRHLVSLALVYYCMFLWRTEAVSEEGTSETSTGGCYRTTLSEYEMLFEEAFSYRLGDNVSTYINCMSFGRDRNNLDTAIVSGRRLTSETVLRFSCQSELLFVMDEENRQFSPDLNESCVKCAPQDMPMEPACVTACDEKCERCYETSNKCDCSRYVYNTEEIVRLVEEEVGEDDKRVDDSIEEIIEDNSQCDSECRQDHYALSSEHRNPPICYPCGIRFCAECEEEEEGGKRECKKCLPHTELYHEGNEGEGECLFGIFAEILHIAEEQEEEVEEEEREKEVTRLELAITLPIISVLVIAFFLIMSFIAHKRYPHIGETGKTRHRNKPPAVAEDEVAVDDRVFRPQPTVRLR